MISCPICKAEVRSVGSSVIDGEYRSARCGACLNEIKPSVAPTGRYQEYKRDRQREDHRKDILQPWDGFKPNRDFIREYPDKAQQYFSKQELNRYG